jgi:hypothetical protein
LFKTKHPAFYKMLDVCFLSIPFSEISKVNINDTALYEINIKFFYGFKSQINNLVDLIK